MLELYFFHQKDEYETIFIIITLFQPLLSMEAASQYPGLTGPMYPEAFVWNPTNVSSALDVSQGSCRKPSRHPTLCTKACQKATQFVRYHQILERDYLDQVSSGLENARGGNVGKQAAILP